MGMVAVCVGVTLCRVKRELLLVACCLTPSTPDVPLAGRGCWGYVVAGLWVMLGFQRRVSSWSSSPRWLEPTLPEFLRSALTLQTHS